MARRPPGSVTARGFEALVAKGAAPGWHTAAAAVAPLAVARQPAHRLRASYLDSRCVPQPPRWREHAGSEWTWV